MARLDPENLSPVQQECFSAPDGGVTALCVECPWQSFAPDMNPADCQSRIIGRSLLFREGELEASEQENARLRGGLEITKWDELLVGFLTNSGLKAEVLLNQDLRRELSVRNFGMLRWDMRGLDWINDVSHDIGDDMLKIVAHEMRRAVRAGAHTEPYIGENRRGEAPVTSLGDFDILYFRPGGDEGGLIMRNIIQSDFTSALGRVRSKFSVDNALQMEGLPLILSIGGIHAQDVPPPAELDEQTDEEAANMYSYLMLMRRHADSDERQEKAAQQQQMWAEVVRRDPTVDHPSGERPHKRIITQYFFETCFSHFAANRSEAIRTVIVGIESQTST